MIRDKKDFAKLQTEAKEAWERVSASRRPVFTVGTATCGRSAGSLEVKEALEGSLKRRGIEGDIMETGCIGLCYEEPIVTIMKPGDPAVLYGQVSPKTVDEIVESHLVKDDPLKKYALGTLGKGSLKGIEDLYARPVLASQVRRIMQKCGVIDPANILHSLWLFFAL